MFVSPRRLIVFLVLLCGVSPSRAAAEQVRFRFVPSSQPGVLVQVPAGPGGALGERRATALSAPQPYNAAVRPNQMVTFRHPFTGGNVTVPLRLPDSTPLIQHRPDRVIFNYGSYAVEARFLRDGSVEVVYNSGFLRPIRFD